MSAALALIYTVYYAVIAHYSYCVGKNGKKSNGA